MGTFDRMVWALGHSLWEAVIAAAVLWGTLRVLPVRYARLRYVVSLAAMGAVVFALFVTWRGVHIGAGGELRAISVVSARQRGAVTAGLPGQVVAKSGGGQGLSPHARMRWTVVLGLLWGMGVLGMLIRMGVGLGRAQRLAAAGRPVELPALQALARGMGIGRVRLLVSEAYRIPAVIGAWSPVILMPAALLAEMPTEQMRLILAHELAHIRRWDFLVNLVQGVIEALLFFNPAVWWISRQVRVEREACCDAAAVAVAGDRQAMARTLAVVAEWAGDAWLPTGALAAGHRQGGLVERVRRLLQPGGRAGIRFPARMFLAGLGASAVVLVVLAASAQLTVMAAEKILTPKERVAREATLQKEAGADGGFTSEDPEKYAPEGLLEGTVRTEDGRPLPKKSYVMARTSDLGYSAQYSCFLKSGGAFSQRVRGDRAAAWGDFPGYAVAFSGPLSLRADGTFPPVQLVLRKGYEGKGLLQNPAGNPIGNAKITVEQLIDDGGGMQVGFGFGHCSTDAEGRFTVARMTERPVRLTVEAPGYQFAQFTCTFEEGKATTLTMQTAHVTNGVVVDSVSGRPLAGAAIRMLARNGFMGGSWCPYQEYAPNNPPLVATADAAGHFSLDELRDDCTYTLWVEAPGHASEVFREIRAGQRDLRWELKPASPIVIQVEADPGKLPKSLDINGGIRLRANLSMGYSRKVPIVVQEDAGTATIDDLPPGGASATAGGKSIRVARGSEPLVLDLRAAANPPQAKREVLIKLEWPADGAQPRGKLRIDYLTPEMPNAFVPGEAPIEGGEARVTIPVPATFQFSQGTLVGYWFPEQTNLQVPVGKAPYVVTAHLKPAGAIHGRVLDTDGQPFAEDCSVSVYPIRRAPSTDGQMVPNLQPFNIRHRSGSYFVSPLPLGGTYRLVAWADARFAVSRDISVDERHPIGDVDLRFKEGQTLSGSVLGPNGSPMPGVSVSLDVSVPGCGGYSGLNRRTDREGHFEFQHIDPQVGTYALDIHPTRTTQGKRMENVSPGSPLDVRLKAGLTARGRVLNVENGKPMANVTVRLRPQDLSAAAYSSWMETMTDNAGQFEFTGLEPIDYVVMFSGIYPAASKVLRDSAGHVTGVQSPPQEPTIHGGATEEKEIRCIPSPWR